MAVNAFLVHGLSGVVVDGMLTVSDAGKARRALAASGRPLAGVVITHPHPDHYAGLAHIVEDEDVPIITTAAVDTIIRRDDAVKDEIVGPMMGDEWPARRRFPTATVGGGAEVKLAGLVFRESARSLSVSLGHGDRQGSFRMISRGDHNAAPISVRPA